MPLLLVLFVEDFINREHVPVEVGKRQLDLSLMVLQEPLPWPGQTGIRTIPGVLAAA